MLLKKEGKSGVDPLSITRYEKIDRVCNLKTQIH